MSTSSQVTQNAPAPFSSTDSHPDLGPADFILRSSDAFDFFVHKETLAAASDFFNGMFSVPHTSADSNTDGLARDGLPVLILSETKFVLLKVLKLAYRTTAPNPVITLKSLDYIIAVQQAVDKYQFTTVDQMLSGAAKEDMSNLLGAANPLRMFVIAMFCGYTEAAQAAMRIAARSSLDFLTVDFPEMRMLTWPQGKEIERLCHSYPGFVANLLKLQIGYLPKEVEPLGLRKALFRRVAPAPTTNNPVNNPPNPLNPLNNPLIPSNNQVVFVWWQPEGHAATCLAAHTSYQRSKLVPIGADTPLACTILSRSVSWFEEHIKRLRVKGPGDEDLLTWMSRHPPEKSPVAALATVGREVQQTINRCRLCAQNAKVHLQWWAELLAKDLADMDGHLDLNVSRMVAK
ncbi:hypothetical protein C8F01DRAFT_1148084 [Mycena amicta]|nr:hypothetical protein C8F01DRAFT_1148084 [Mycena amicta]